MPKIEFRENKTLKLTNVLSREVPATELLSQNKQVLLLQNWLKTKGYETVGPLIFFTATQAGVTAPEELDVRSKIMIQLNTCNVRLESPYFFRKELRIENCLMARFADKAEKLQFAMQKLSLYAYENDLELTGDTYVIIAKQTADFLNADVFMSVKGKIEDSEGI
jgi:hypothetical protein